MVYLLIILIFIIIFLFSSKTLSPIPYFPSQPIDMEKIVKALNLRNDQTIIDLGAGDGIVIFKAADEALKQKLNTQFVAIDINPILILVLYVRRLFHQNKQNIKIIHDDIFKMKFDFLAIKQFNNITIYLYISPWYLEKTISNIKNQTCLPAGRYQNFSVVSYMYPIKSLKNREKIIQGKNKIFTYR